MEENNKRWVKILVIREIRDIKTLVLLASLRVKLIALKPTVGDKLSKYLNTLRTLSWLTNKNNVCPCVQQK